MQKLLLFSGIKYTVKPTKSLIANKKKPNVYNPSY